MYKMFIVATSFLIAKNHLNAHQQEIHSYDVILFSNRKKQIPNTT